MTNARPRTPPEGTYNAATVFRSHIDSRVWMCNISEVDLVDGITASVSKRAVKRHVEEVVSRDGEVAAWWIGDEYWVTGQAPPTFAEIIDYGRGKR